MFSGGIEKGTLESILTYFQAGKYLFNNINENILTQYTCVV